MYSAPQRREEQERLMYNWNQCVSTRNKHSTIFTRSSFFFFFFYILWKKKQRVGFVLTGFLRNILQRKQVKILKIKVWTGPEPEVNTMKKKKGNGCPPLFFSAVIHTKR